MKYRQFSSLLLLASVTLASPHFAAAGGGEIIEYCRSDSGSAVPVSGCTTPIAGGLCPTPFFRDIQFAFPFDRPPHVVVSPAVITSSGAGGTPCAGSATDKVLCYPKNITPVGFRLVCSGSPTPGACGDYSSFFTRTYANWLAFDSRPGCQGTSGHLKDAPHCDGISVGGLCNRSFSGNISYAESQLTAAPELITAPENMSSQGGCVGGSMDTFMTYARNPTPASFHLVSYASPYGTACGAYGGWTSLADSGFFGAVDRKSCLVDSEQLLTTNVCPTGASAAGICAKPWQREVKFTKFFTTIPTVIVSPQMASAATPCSSGGTTDAVQCIVVPGSLWRGGMTVQCNGSPGYASCGAGPSGYFSRAQFSYIAIDHFCKVAECQDGRDNDNDGLTDLQDPGCRQNPNFDDETGAQFLPAPPSGVQATDGTVRDAVEITWIPPSTPVGRYQIYRSSSDDSNGNPLGPPVSGTTTSFRDTTAVPGQVYYYLVFSEIPSGRSRASNVDSGFRPASAAPQCADRTDNDGDGLVDLQDPGCRSDSSGDDEGSEGAHPGAISSIQASDGTSSDAVVVTWSASSDATGYQVYRSSAAGQAGVQIGVTAGDRAFSDITAVASVTYFYSVVPTNTAASGPRSGYDSGFRAVAAVPQCSDGRDNDGDGLIDSNDPGCANNPNSTDESAEGSRPGRAASLDASDGTSESFVEVHWSAAPGASSYQLYRSQFASELGDPVGAAAPGLEALDRSAVPGVFYFYSVIALNAAGQGLRSPVDSGYRRLPGGEIDDSDGDGSNDYQESADGTDPFDPGSFQLHLKSPAFTKYNTFLGQLNFLELIANGIKPVQLNVTAFDLQGNVVGRLPVFLAQGQQYDVDVLSLIGNRTNSYGVVKIEFDDSIPGSSVIGRMTNYRANSGAADYSFAFARELRNPTRGVTYATANSYDPQGRGWLVPNWAEIVNLSETPQDFVATLYDQRGRALYSKVVTVPSLGEVDIQAGHEYGENVYLFSATPLDGSAKYFMAVSRYSSNSPRGVEPDTYNFAFSLEGRSGSGAPQFAPVQNRTGTCWSQTNWLEIVNTREKAVTASVDFRSSAGALLAATSLELSSRSQYHLNAEALFPKGTDGFATIHSNDPGAIIAQSLIYFHDCQANQLETAFSIQARGTGQDVQSGSLNSFLGMKNELLIANTTGRSLDIASSITGAGAPISEQIHLDSNAQSLRSLNGPGSAFPESSYGVIRLDSARRPRTFAAFITRSRELPNGKMDFVFPTGVQ